MEEIIKDAIRYRWLRDTNNMRSVSPEDEHQIGDIEDIMVWDSDCSLSSIDDKEFDKVIDRAMLFQKLYRG